jgi:pilus assembly protein CpaB
MRNRKTIGLISAVLLAAVGTLSLSAYVRSAEDRAVAGEELVDVLVVRQPVAAGTSSADLATKVRIEQVPVKIRAGDALVSMDDVEGLVPDVDLVPGEQLLKTRFVRAEEQGRRTSLAPVPVGLHEITVALDPERALGGHVQAGDTVSVIASFDPFDVGKETVIVDGVQMQGGDRTANTSHIILHKVLVTRVQYPKGEAVGGEEPVKDEEDRRAPKGKLLVTLATDAPSAERLVFTAEFGRIWLTYEPLDAPEDGTRIQSRGSVYVPTEPQGDAR